MTLLDIAISQPCSCFGNPKLGLRSEIQFRNNFLIGNGSSISGSISSRGTFSWKTLCIRENVGRGFFTLERERVWRGGLTIKAVATLEIASVVNTGERVNGYRSMLGADLDSVRTRSLPDFEPQSSSEDSTDLDDREKLRRMRISKANKGNTPWNKGKKHSPETLQLIKERTRLAMQDPKVKMKLITLGHAQSEETRIKIAVGVRLGWERRRKKLRVQETCQYQWQNLIAGAARQGLLGEEELKWDSYNVLNKELEKEWLQSVEQRRNTPRPKGSRRAPKSTEQKRKIAEAIAAKWTDPEYRYRVCNGQAKFHGIPEGVERKPRRKPGGDGQTRKSGPEKKGETNENANREAKIQIQRTRSKRSKPSPYKDPLANSKLEMLKGIRAERASAMNNKSVAVARAKLLIAEAEKAAEALEIAATKKTHFAQDSLIESRILIAEAHQIIYAIENEETIPSEHQTGSDALSPEIIKQKKVNGTPNGSVSRSFSAEIVLETDEKLHQVTSNGSLPGFIPNSNGSPVERLDSRSDNLEGRPKQANLTKKWVRGRLVEVAEKNLG